MDDENRTDAPDEVLDPAAALALLNRQQQSVQYQQSAFVWVIELAWGIAWSVGFVLLWLIDGAKPAFSIPLPVAAIAFAAIVTVAIVISIVLGVRSSRGVRPSAAASFQGTVYGVTWSVSMVAVWLFASGLQFNGMTGDLVAIFYPVAYVMMTGILFLFSASLYQAKPMVFLGGWIVLIAVIAPFFGYPNHYLFLAIAGGGSLLVMSVIVAVYTARLRRKAAGHV
ncbi:hypothetical protein N1027_10300 [Herbiconiux sp. CPCC 205763]|uniref:Uncharacterized protein n=1 Tax=Herbiconiux aconitum TaxID=2970913 RepID=A0ABT2GQM7_9MICO|nr:hypothetical protein [Herbiconiux aconitum]MCS5718524.1 hypothetical protein [Herbiconiux aconitum]